MATVKMSLASARKQSLAWAWNSSAPACSIIQTILWVNPESWAIQARMNYNGHGKNNRSKIIRFKVKVKGKSNIGKCGGNSDQDVKGDRGQGKGNNGLL